MTIFRPCIDLHNGCVKQIVGGTLRDTGAGLVENFASDRPSSWFASKYHQDRLTGGHIIKLGPGNDRAASEALSAYRHGMQIGGGITVDNAQMWLDAGASHVIVTSWLFDQQGKISTERLESLAASIGTDRIVLDLSCRRTDNDGNPRWTVAMNRWQTLTDVDVTPSSLSRLARYADEFLIHAADVEGLCQGIDEQLVELMGRWAGLPMTYAGGVASMEDVQRVKNLSAGAVDVTVGSSLDLFGGTGVRYQDLVDWNRNTN